MATLLGVFVSERIRILSHGSWLAVGTLWKTCSGQKGFLGFRVGHRTRSPGLNSFWQVRSFLLGILAVLEQCCGKHGLCPKTSGFDMIDPSLE
jgi:hypothetical protein